MPRKITHNRYAEYNKVTKKTVQLVRNLMQVRGDYSYDDAVLLDDVIYRMKPENRKAADRFKDLDRTPEFFLP
jgi:hypothetical protein